MTLAALELAEPGLFAEFKMHFQLMGEKSFDHTKKYWFNKLRHQYQFIPEAKIEKPHIANPLAEQTIAESHIEAGAIKSAPKQGFVPRFKAAAVAKSPQENIQEVKDAPVSDGTVVPASIEKPLAKPGSLPGFKASNITKTVLPEANKKEGPSVDGAITLEPEPETPAAKPAYKPPFNPKNIPPKPEQ